MNRAYANVRGVGRCSGRGRYRYGKRFKSHLGSGIINNCCPQQQCRFSRDDRCRRSGYPCAANEDFQIIHSHDAEIDTVSICGVARRGKVEGNIFESRVAEFDREYREAIATLGDENIVDHDGWNVVVDDIGGDFEVTRVDQQCFQRSTSD